MPNRTIASPPGWYFCRVDESMHLTRYAIGAWQVHDEAAGGGATPLLAKPRAPGLVPPDAEDRAAMVGLVPPDREYASFFSSEDIQDAAKRLFAHRHPREAEDLKRATVREVDLPGVGPYPVRDARPPGQRDTADWIKRAWGGGPASGPGPGDAATGRLPGA
jgi:hypothetical protein